MDRLKSIAMDGSEPCTVAMDESELESPTCVMESLALESGREFKVRRMSKEFDRLRSKAESVEGSVEQQHCANEEALNQISLEEKVVSDTSATSTKEVYPVGEAREDTFVAMLRERRDSLQSMQGRRSRDNAKVRHVARCQPAVAES